MEPTISSLIADAESGNREASDALFTALYSDLHRTARGRLARNAGELTLGLIIDYARNRRAQKRGGKFEIASIETDVVDRSHDDKELTRISDALDGLAAVDPLLVQVVDLEFFCRFSLAEITAMRGQSERTVQRHWEKARISLHGAIGRSA